MHDVAIYLVIGAFSGVLSGLLGIGGGALVVPALSLVFLHFNIASSSAMPMAAGTSLMIMVFTTQASLMAHHNRGAVLWMVYRRMMPGIVMGVVVGALLADRLPTFFLSLALAIFLLLVAIKMLLPMPQKTASRTPPPVVDRFVSMLVGFKSGLLGLGGGTITIPYLTYCHHSIRHAVGTSSACSFTIALVGATAFFFTGMNETNLPAYSWGYIYWPAVFAVAIPSRLCVPLGVHLSHRLSINTLQRIFALFLLIVCAQMLMSF